MCAKMQWFPLQVLVLTFVCFHGALRTAATVVTDFKDVDKCVKGFYKDTPPAGIIDPKMKKICQVLEDEPRFVTVYDPELRIPILSAYKFETPGGDDTEEFDAMYEPQLVNPNVDGNMKPIPADHEELEKTQAVPEDYSSSALHKILRLNPITYHSSEVNRKSVFTLTNAVPQISTLTSWKDYERETRELLKTYCLGTAYVITGVTVGEDIRRVNKDRVAIPENLWSAYCCDNFNREAPEGILQRLPARAALVRNADGEAVREMTVHDLEEMLKTKPEDPSIKLFADNCVSL